MRFTYEQYHAFSAPLEGRVPGMYVDCLGLITCAVGCLIDPSSLALQAHWVLEDGSPASDAQIVADWSLLKAGKDHFSKLHWKYALAATKCRLTEDEIDRLVQHRLALAEADMRRAFPEWDTLPADAQLACLSMCWAVGSGWPGPNHFPHLAECVREQDWAGCVANCEIRTAGNPGVVPRNAKNKLCFLNAAAVKSAGSDPGVLHWPNAAGDDLAAQQAAGDAAAALAAWHALDLCPFGVDTSAERDAELRDAERAA